MVKTTVNETYRGQIMRLVDLMSQANREVELADNLSPDSDPSRVKMFVDGNLEKRLEKLRNQLDFLAERFEEFDDLIIAYIRHSRSIAFDSAVSDGDRMLDWLESTRPISDVQRDYIACQRARHAVENEARTHRMKHVRYQELSSLTSRLLEELGANERLRIYLNPVRTWSRFHTGTLLDDGANPPADVLFFAAAGEIATAVLELEGQALVNELVDYEPCTLDEWSALTMQVGRDELLETCRDLAEMGLIALG